MNTKDFVVNDNGERQEIKQVSKVLPNVGCSIILQTLVIEAVHLSNLTGFVISTQDVNSARIANLTLLSIVNTLSITLRAIIKDTVSIE